MTEELFRDDSYLAACEAVVASVGEEGIVLDRTVFYPTGGGQPGDQGTLTAADGRVVRIVDARKGEAGPLHVPEPDQPALAPGDRVTAAIDWPRRYRLMRMHTCLHLLCAAVPAGVTGGQVGDGTGRLDFDLSGVDLALDKASIEAAVNGFIAADRPVAPRWVEEAELDADPGLVRTLSVQPPRGQGRVRLLAIDGVDLQPCGGTHVRRTGEIGPIRVEKIENKGKRNRRVVVAFAEAAS